MPVLKLWSAHITYLDGRSVPNLVIDLVELHDLVESNYPWTEIDYIVLTPTALREAFNPS